MWCIARPWRAALWWVLSVKLSIWRHYKLQRPRRRSLPLHSPQQQTVHTHTYTRSYSMYWERHTNNSQSDDTWWCSKYVTRTWFQTNQEALQPHFLNNFQSRLIMLWLDEPPLSLNTNIQWHNNFLFSFFNFFTYWFTREIHVAAAQRWLYR